MTRRVHVSESHDVCICRPSKWGNQWSHREGTLAKYKVNTRKEAIDKCREDLETNIQLQKDVEELRGKVIACVCRKNQQCHGDVYIEWLHRDTRIEELFHE